MTLHAEHLVTAVNLTNALTTLGARARLLDNHRNTLLLPSVTSVLSILILALHDETVRAGPHLASAALVSRAEKATALAVRTLHNELGTIRSCRLLTFSQSPRRRGTTLTLGSITSHASSELVRSSKNLGSGNLQLLKLLVDQAHLSLGLTHLELGLHTRLASRKN